MNRGYTTSVEEHPEVWDTVVELERKLNGVAGLVDSGTHIILAARRNSR